MSNRRDGRLLGSGIGASTVDVRQWDASVNLQSSWSPQGCWFRMRFLPHVCYGAEVVEPCVGGGWGASCERDGGLKLLTTSPTTTSSDDWRTKRRKGDARAKKPLLPHSCAPSSLSISTSSTRSRPLWTCKRRHSIPRCG